MTAHRELTAVVGVAVAGGLLLLVAEPVLGLAVLAGVGAAALVQPRGRLAVVVVVLVVGVVALVVAWVRTDVVLGLGAAAVTLAAAAATVRSRGWPAPRRGRTQRSDREPTARDTWDALDRGEDPTI